RSGLTGLWAADAKLGSIGIRLSRGVTKHGLSLNVCPDLSYFEGIVPCGIESCEVTSLAKLLGRSVSVDEVAPVLTERLAGLLNAQPRQMTPQDLGLRAIERGVDERPHPTTAVSPRPPWLRTTLRTGPNYADLKRMTKGLKLHTVCEEARCPNIYECWEQREATFLILGDRCTRRCGFCDITTGRPGPLDFGEPVRVAEAVRHMGLKFAVVTGVERDDASPAQVAGIWAATIGAIRDRVPGCKVEVLTGDLKGDRDALGIVLEAQPDVFAHNLETVRRLHPKVRPGFRYERSLEVLRAAKDLAPSVPTKSNLILGLGESRDEVVEALEDLRGAGVDLMTLGQYLAPASEGYLPVQRWVTPAEFEEYKAAGESLGFAWVESGPLVRSSYHAGRQYRAASSRLLEMRGELEIR
ncbi:MAG: lipoyl synthase, partial [Actinomycetota bacterium]